MKVAVIGANGQLGTDIVHAFRSAGHELLGLCHQDIEVSSLDSVRSVLEPQRPGVIVNTAAFHELELCETDPEKAYAVNALGARNLALVARSLDAVLVQISTDYVFDGRKTTPYLEDDLPLPLNVYGNTKLAGEFYVRTLAPKHFVVRTSALYGHAPCRGKGGRNFVELMLRLARERKEVRVVNDERVSPTWTRELAEQLAVLITSDAYGLYHATAEGSCSWYEFAAAIFAFAGLSVNLAVADPSEFPAKVPRPKYSVLENARLKQIGLNRFRHWREGLRDYLQQRQSS